jgi:hypothetical protein
MMSKTTLHSPVSRSALCLLRSLSTLLSTSSSPSTPSSPSPSSSWSTSFCPSSPVTSLLSLSLLLSRRLSLSLRLSRRLSSSLLPLVLFFPSFKVQSTICSLDLDSSFTSLGSWEGSNDCLSGGFDLGEFNESTCFLLDDLDLVDISESDGSGLDGGFVDLLTTVLVF